MSGLTELERRGARVLVVMLALGTLSDLYRARHPEWAPAPALRPIVPAAVSTGGEPLPSRTASVPPLRMAVDLDHASAAELDRLPGIGPVLAARIVAHRERYGRFKSAEELLAVPGIGPRLLERLRPWLKATLP